MCEMKEATITLVPLHGRRCLMHSTLTPAIATISSPLAILHSCLYNEATVHLCQIEREIQVTRMVVTMCFFSMRASIMYGDGD